MNKKIVKNQRVSRTRRSSRIVSFDSISEFLKYIKDNKENEVFSRRKKSRGLESRSRDYEFTKTKSFKEAVELITNGWNEISEELRKQMKKAELKLNNKTYKNKTIYDVAGFQCSVPRYLNGIPTSMINHKRTVTSNNKIITINKCISYAHYISTEQIISESIKALFIVKSLEEQGYRVNLNILMGALTQNKTIGEYVKVKVKNAGERINISKLSFPLVHPSMLRRLMFRYIEVVPNIHQDYAFGYGRVADNNDLVNAIPKNEYVIPPLLEYTLEDIAKNKNNILNEIMLKGEL